MTSVTSRRPVVLRPLGPSRLSELCQENVHCIAKVLLGMLHCLETKQHYVANPNLAAYSRNKCVTSPQHQPSSPLQAVSIGPMNSPSVILSGAAPHPGHQRLVSHQGVPRPQGYAQRTASSPRASGGSTAPTDASLDASVDGESMGL